MLAVGLSPEQQTAVTGGTAITGADLTSAPPLNLPETLQEPNYQGTISSIPQIDLSAYLEPNKFETTQNEFSQRILDLTKTLGGKETKQLESEQQAGIPQLRTQLQDVVGQIQALQKEALAIPLQTQQDITGRGVTRAASAVMDAEALRKNTIRALGLSAIGQTLQGNLALAQQQVDRAIDIEFGKQETELNFLKTAYQLNKDVLERQDKKRADVLRIQLSERDRIIKEVREDRKSVYEVGLLARQFGAPTNIIQDIFNSRDPEEALVRAGGYLQDPASKLQLESINLNNQLTKQRIQREAAEFEIFQRYGGLTPTQWLAQRKQEEEDEATKASEKDQAIGVGRELGKDITQINSILNSPALDSVVGPNPFARSFSRTKGFFPKMVGFFGTLPQAFGVVDEISGGADDVVALTEQLISQQFLDKLVSEKGKGATFGQLSDREGAALRAAANAIGQTAIRDKKDKVVGYDMSESEFRRQMNIVLEGLKLNYTKWTGESFTPEEAEVLDEFFPITSKTSTKATTFNPSF